MHKLTKDRMQWEAWALLSAMILALGTLFRHGLALVLEYRNAFHLVLLGSEWQMAAGIGLLLLLHGVPEQPGKTAATFISLGMMWLPLVGPLLVGVCIWILCLWPILLLMLAALALWLLVCLARMKHGTAFLVALIGLTWSVVGLLGWLGVLLDL